MHRKKVECGDVALWLEHGKSTQLVYKQTGPQALVTTSSAMQLRGNFTVANMYKTVRILI